MYDRRSHSTESSFACHIGLKICEGHPIKLVAHNSKAVAALAASSSTSMCSMHVNVAACGTYHVA